MTDIREGFNERFLVCVCWGGGGGGGGGIATFLLYS